MLRRLFAILGTCLALLATHSAWAAPVLCRAEAEHRVCHCQHASGFSDGQQVADDCCTPSKQDEAAPGTALPLPSPFVFDLPAPQTGPARVAQPNPRPRIPHFLESARARAPPTALYISLRTLLN